MLNTALRELPTLGRGGLTDFLDFFEAQDRVPIICEAIANRVRAGAAPSVAIATELRERFPDRDQLDSVHRYLFALMSSLAAEYLRSRGAR